MTSSGPTALRERALGPDLARGVMLLFIALANSHYFLYTPPILGGFPQDVGTVDLAVTWVISTFVDGRAFPLFGLLFGYGVARIVARHDGPPKATRRLLWRRAGVLIVVGLVDGLLFWAGDILAMYGVLLLVGAWAVRWRDRWLLVVAVLFTALNLLPGGGDPAATSAEGPDPGSMLSPDPWTQVVDRLPVVGFIALLGPIGFAAPYLVGLWAGRRQVLEQPERHRTLLRWTAVVGIGAAVLAAQPAALTVIRVVSVPDASTLDNWGLLHDAGGLLGGAGYAAAIALLATHLRRGPVVDALAATGQRSMTCYLLQSPVWWVLFSGYTLDLSDDLSVTALALIATATWLATVVLSARMRGRGPFERLVRRATYGAPARVHDG